MADPLNARNHGLLPDLIGIEVVEAAGGRAFARLAIRPELLNAAGQLHGGTVVALADTTCGAGARANLPEGAEGHTTAELKMNFVGTASEGVISCEATLSHAGRSTQVWDARVDDPDGRTMGLFRCTQMVLYR